jgi:hypothetical protein
MCITYVESKSGKPTRMIVVVIQANVVALNPPLRRLPSMLPILHFNFVNSCLTSVSMARKPTSCGAFARFVSRTAVSVGRAGTGCRI